MNRSCCAIFGRPTNRWSAARGNPRGLDLSGTLEGAGGIGGLLARSDNYSGGTFSRHDYYHADGNGNITYLADNIQGLAASYRYDPYGNLLSSSGTLAADNTYRFSSREYIPSIGLYAYLYRFYNPGTQRWLNRDPIQEWGGVNLYGYVGNAPVNVVDILGLDKNDADAGVGDSDNITAGSGVGAAGAGSDKGPMYTWINDIFGGTPKPPQNPKPTDNHPCAIPTSSSDDTNGSDAPPSGGPIVNSPPPIFQPDDPPLDTPILSYPPLMPPQPIFNPVYGQQQIPIVYVPGRGWVPLYTFPPSFYTWHS